MVSQASRLWFGPFETTGQDHHTEFQRVSRIAAAVQRRSAHECWCTLDHVPLLPFVSTFFSRWVSCFDNVRLARGEPKGNILVLRGHIEILPHDRTTVSYELLSQLVGEYLLTNCPDIDISAALSIMPSTTS